MAAHVPSPAPEGRDRRPSHVGVPARCLAWWSSLGLGAVVLVALAVRFVALDADPHPHLVMFDHITDEGWYSQNARNHALFGTWVIDEHNPALVLCPLHTLVLRLCYGLGGVSFATTRLPGTLASVLTVALVFWTMRRLGPARWIGTALVACNPLLLAYSRTAFVESLQMTWVTLGWAASLRPEARAQRLVCGAAAALAVLTKPTAYPIVIYVLAAPWITASAAPLRTAIWVAAGGALATLPFIPFVLLQGDLVWAEMTQENLFASAARGFDGLATPFLLGAKPDAAAGLVALGGHALVVVPLATLLGVAIAGCVATARRADADDRTAQARLLARSAAAWLLLELVGFTVQHSVQYYTRHWLRLMVPMSVLVAAAFVIGRNARLTARPPVLGLAAFCALLGPAALLRIPLSQFLLSVGVPARSSYLIVTMVVGLVLGGVVVAACLAKLLVRWPPDAAVLRRAGLMLVAGTVGILAVWSWVDVQGIRGATFTIRAASRELRSLTHCTGLFGATANTLALETPHRAFVVRDLAATGLSGEGTINADWRGLGGSHWLLTLQVEGAPRPRPSWAPTVTSVVREFSLVPGSASASRFVIACYLVR
jgi:4-amino-4-deoxy-L-arabinose transferase-like glycosyltransferase